MSEIKNTDVIENFDISDEELNALIDGTITDFDDGDLVSGTIVKIERDEVLVDIGFKSEGVIPVRELSIRREADPSELVEIGEEIEALVLQKEDKDGRLILSRKRAEYERAWIDIEQKFNAGENVIGEVIEVVKGGLILDIGLRGFLPASLVDLRRVKDLECFTGEQIEARIIEMDRNRNNVVLSRRVVLEEGRKSERSEILEKLTKGMRLKGAVSSIVEFGAFVDLGGIDGLVHISELSWNHVSHPAEVVKVGDDVEVEVLDVDMKRERISLGLKQTTEDPWRQLVKNFPIGAILEGKITKLVSFGTFVELGDGIEGLVHISEMANKHILLPSQVVSVGDAVHVKVMDIDPERRRISLSMKAAAELLGIEIKVTEIDESSSKSGKHGKSNKANKTEDALEDVLSADLDYDASKIINDDASTTETAEEVQELDDAIAAVTDASDVESEENVDDATTADTNADDAADVALAEPSDSAAEADLAAVNSDDADLVEEVSPIEDIPTSAEDEADTIATDYTIVAEAQVAADESDVAALESDNNTEETTTIDASNTESSIEPSAEPSKEESSEEAANEEPSKVATSDEALAE
ncbi:MAG: 30S ribosomal protein S1 [Coriobacteriales bacterium]|nr:30S ribosomal protein S1 [Coriobacteriales bacterium]